VPSLIADGNIATFQHITLLSLPAGQKYRPLHLTGLPGGQNIASFQTIDPTSLLAGQRTPSLPFPTLSSQSFDNLIFFFLIPNSKNLQL
jgi:hypothetical protein